MKRALVLFAVVLSLAALLAACGGGGTAATPTQPAGGTTPATGGAASSGPVAVEEGDFTLKPSVTTVKAGTIKFDVTNKGALPHEFVIIKTDTAPASLPVVEGKVNEAAAGTVVGQRIPEAQLGAGKSASASYELTAGKYVLLCNVVGHYQSGMYSGFTVQ